MAMHAHSALEYYSVADYCQWAGDWELIGGIPLAMAPSPAIEHQRLGARIVRQFAEALDHCPQCEVLYEMDVEFSRDTVVRPDVLVICFAPAGERLTQAPDVIFEILSPATARRDERTKFQLYQDEGVRWYVLVDPIAARAKVYRLVAGEYRKVGDFRSETCQFELACGVIAFDFKRVWPDHGATAAG